MVRVIPLTRAFRRRRRICCVLACFVLVLIDVRMATAQETQIVQPADTTISWQIGTAPDTAAVVLGGAQDTTGAVLRTGAEQLSGTPQALEANPGAQDGVASVEEDGVQRLEIDGLVVDETQSKLGRDFYDAFYSRWHAPEGAFNFTVVVKEQPMPNLGTRIIVNVNEEIAFQAQLQPRYDVIQAMAQQAVAYTAYLLQNRTPSQFGY